MKKIPVRHITKAPVGPVATGRFSIREISKLLGGKDLVQELHRHDFFFILALQKGSGTHVIDFTSYNIGDNSIFILRPGQVHQLELKASSTGYLMEFDTTFYHPKNNAASQRLGKASNKNFCTVEKRRFEKLLSVLEYIFSEFTEQQDEYTEIIQANLDIFFIEFLRQSLHTTPANSNSYSQERLENFLELLESHIKEYKQVSQYADLLNLSVYQLNAITKATVGKLASVLINEQIILEAKRYLLASSNQVKDIADHLGYEDISYFIRFFKKHTGYSPEAFRKNFL